MTIILIVITVIVSVIAFNRKEIFDKLKFNAFLIYKYKQWHRFLSYGLIHADLVHLAVNMFVLYSFGAIVEQFFQFHFENRGYIYYFFLYAGGIAFSTLYDFGQQKNNGHYNAVGASGAVAAVVFSSILLYPAGKIFLFFIPIGIPSPIFGILYLGYSFYMARKGKDNIGHNAHFFGAIFGVIYTIAIKPEFLVLFIKYLF